jgi:hypothetical protein
MINIHTTIKGLLVPAMKSKDEVRIRVIRGLLTAFMNELVATGKTPQDVLDDTLSSKVILKTIKQREDAINQFTSAGRMDLAQEDTLELTILKEYAPVMATDDEVLAVINKVKSSIDFDTSKVGILIGAVKKELGEKGDGVQIKRLIDSIIN